MAADARPHSGVIAYVPGDNSSLALDKTKFSGQPEYMELRGASAAYEATASSDEQPGPKESQATVLRRPIGPSQSVARVAAGCYLAEAEPVGYFDPDGEVV